MGTNPLPSFRVGDILRVPDSLTGFSSDPEKWRWCMVVADLGFSIRVLPRSSSGGSGVFVPADAMEVFTEDGHFYRDVKTIHLTSLRGYTTPGPLPEPYCSSVLELARQRHRKGGPR